MNLYSLLADTVVVLHAAYVSFVLLGFVAIVLGIVLRWRWIRSFWFRSVHLLMIAIVVAEAFAGIPCPLTIWEDKLRLAAGESVHSGSFLGRLVHNLLFYEAEPWVFTVAYSVFGGLVLATFLLAPPKLPKLRSKRADVR